MAPPPNTTTDAGTSSVLEDLVAVPRPGLRQARYWQTNYARSSRDEKRPVRSAAVARRREKKPRSRARRRIARFLNECERTFLQLLPPIFCELADQPPFARQNCGRICTVICAAQSEFGGPSNRIRANCRFEQRFARHAAAQIQSPPTSAPPSTTAVLNPSRAARAAAA